MTKISDLLGKPLISLADAMNVGYISNVFFDKKLTRAKAAEITSDEDERPEYTYLRFSSLRCDGDAAVIKALSPSALAGGQAESFPCPINCKGFNQSGKDLGYIRDVILERTRVTGIVCDKATFTPRELLSVSSNMCIFNDTGAPIKIAKPRPSKPKTPPAPKRTVLPENAVFIPPAPQSVTVTRTPGEPVKDYSFLLGKPVRTPVTSGGKIIIPAGAIVSEKIIELARKEGKLVQLAIRAY